ncbi:MAG: hypothetical protein JSS00_10555, partial [Proteobacteria bacterium]|nr:hypothetical protein [Pseudomonadota bacterium]
MREQRGLPIAAHLGLLVALAFASAFVGIIAVVIWLPPRPPDVMRADMVAQHFQDGYAATRSSGHVPDRDAMEWAIASAPPSDDEASPFMELVRVHLARHLGLRPEQVRLGAAHFARSDVFVFRVRDAEQHIEIGGDHLYLRRPHGELQRPVPTPDAAPAAPRPPGENIEVRIDGEAAGTEIGAEA